MKRRLVAVLSAAAITPFTGQVATAGTPRPHQHLVPVAGNGSYLVYARVGPSCEQGNPTLHVRTLGGGTRKLPLPRPVGWSLNPCAARLVGHTLVIFHATRRVESEVVYWWDLASRRHGRTVMPEAVRRLSSLTPIPGGWVYSLGRVRYPQPPARTLYRQGTGGKVTKFGTFAPFDPGVVLSGPRGLVLEYGTDLRYVDYQTKKITRLDLPAHRWGRRDCQAVVTTFVACSSHSDNNDGYATRYEQSMTPLNGGPTRTCTTCFSAADYEASRPVTFTPIGITSLHADGSLLTFSLHGKKKTTGPGHGASSIGAAYGKLIVGHQSGNISEQERVTTKQAVILRV